jgi:hypothetical protein
MRLEGGEVDLQIGQFEAQIGHLIGQRRDAPAEQLDADLLLAHLGIIQFFRPTSYSISLGNTGKKAAAARLIQMAIASD